MLMAGHDIQYRETIDTKITGIAKGLGIEFKKRK